MSGITQEEIEQAQAREEQGNHDDHCKREEEAPMNKLEALREAVKEYDDRFVHPSDMSGIVEAVHDLLSDPDNAVVLVPRHRDSEGKPTCCGCLFSQGYYSRFCAPLQKDNEHGPLPGCPVWCGCKIEEVSR